MDQPLSNYGNESGGLHPHTLNPSPSTFNPFSGELSSDSSSNKQCYKSFEEIVFWKVLLSSFHEILSWNRPRNRVNQSVPVDFRKPCAKRSGSFPENAFQSIPVNYSQNRLAKNSVIHQADEELINQEVEQHGLVAVEQRMDQDVEQPAQRYMGGPYDLFVLTRYEVHVAHRLWYVGVGMVQFGMKTESN
ncbi:hypothetical protein MTR_7g056017 [Medicago truncatula]|uniref:Uncharacterized protein n=1 Tax=Medicago truncatula TaxID=3880 RepID=A0A072U9T7_MEDTR|nr:hypothetical protein MTR_7g056017 [Medicago truncatula]